MSTVGTMPTRPESPPPIPPLEQGDFLTRAEFERRYEAMPEVKRAELLEGEVYMPSPVRLRKHSSPHADLVAWFGAYRVQTPGILVGDNSSVRLALDSEPQPDVVLLIEPECGGRANISEDDYIEGSPELVAEVSSSTKSIDLNKKLRIYRKNKVLEYVVWRVDDGDIDWFSWKNDQYQPLARDANTWYRSVVFPGLWLDAAALIRKDLAGLHQVLQQGIASPEHAAFVAELQKRKPG